mmetsp:Transcript_15549/g.31520  ORF Transcript_15549/g.31520 Transcript_15549/m.31520 type:complete len:252 (-) Transcript_15549:1-756(-)
MFLEKALDRFRVDSFDDHLCWSSWKGQWGVRKSRGVGKVADDVLVDHVSELSDLLQERFLDRVYIPGVNFRARDGFSENFKHSRDICADHFRGVGRKLPGCLDLKLGAHAIESSVHGESGVVGGRPESQLFEDKGRTSRHLVFEPRSTFHNNADSGYGLLVIDSNHTDAVGERSDRGSISRDNRGSSFRRLGNHWLVKGYLWHLRSLEHIHQGAKRPGIFLRRDASDCAREHGSGGRFVMAEPIFNGNLAA